MRKRSRQADEPLTAERVERALDKLAIMMAELGPAGRVYLPVYVRLERDLAEMLEADVTMDLVLARAKRSQDRKAGSP